MKWFGRGKNPRPAIDSGAEAEPTVLPSAQPTPTPDTASTATDHDISDANSPDTSAAIETNAVEVAGVRDSSGNAGPKGSEAGGLGSVGLNEASEQIGPESANEPTPASSPLPEEAPRSGGWFTTRRIIGWFSTILMIVILFLAWPLAWGGLFSYTVVSGKSMEPTYHTGDVVMTYRTSDYQVGEIIVYTVTFDDKTGAIIHRIVEVLPDGDYKTKGDNNDFVDPWVAEPQNIRGEVIAVFPQAYKVVALIRSPLFWIIPIGIGVAYFLWPAKPEVLPPEDDDLPPEGVDDPASPEGPCGDLGVDDPASSEGPYGQADGVPTSPSRPLEEVGIRAT